MRLQKQRHVVVFPPSNLRVFPRSPRFFEIGRLRVINVLSFFFRRVGVRSSLATPFSVELIIEWSFLRSRKENVHPRV